MVLQDPGDTETFLDSILQKVSKDGLSFDEVDRLTTLFTPSIPPPIRSKTFLVLSAHCERISKSSDNGQDSDAVLQSFLPAVEKRLADVEEGPMLEALTFASALFTVQRQAASRLFIRDGYQDSMMDSLDLFSSSPDVSHAVADVLSIACGHKACVSSLSPRCLAWLDTTFRKSSDEKLKGRVALALLKISRSPKDELSGVPVSSSLGNDGEQQDALYSVMRSTIVNSSGPLKDLSVAVEGLAYFTTIAQFKDRLSKDTELLKKIISLKTYFRNKASMVEHDIPGPVPFGLCAIIANVCAYKPRLGEEEANIAKLRRMASAAGSSKGPSAVEEDTLDDDQNVSERCKRLISAGAVDLLVAIAKATESSAVRLTVGKALLSLVEDKSNRGKIMQAGGVKTLLLLIGSSQTQSDSAQSQPTRSNVTVEYSDLTSIQALAKLAITSMPLQLFGADNSGAIDCIQPFMCLLTHKSSTLLQNFEALMALTNVSSYTPEISKRIAETRGLLPKAEFLLLDDNTMVRRAATELICNLVNGGGAGMNYFSGDGPQGNTLGGINQATARLRILVALCDVEDESTRRAASGALAIIISNSPRACQQLLILEFEHHRVLSVFKQLIDPTNEEGEPLPAITSLVHRGVFCIKSLFLSTTDASLRARLASEARSQGIPASLMKVLRGTNANPEYKEFLTDIGVALKWLVDSNVRVA